MQALYDWEKLLKCLSMARLEGYQTLYAQRLSKNPVSLYRWNIELSESLYPLLNVIEVAFRNTLYQAIAEHFQDPEWLLTPEFLAPVDLHKVQKKVTILRRMQKLDIGHLIAELTFGFWCSLLDRRYEHQQLLWPTLLRQAFPYMKNRKIHVIRTRFNRILSLRNRIYHYEPIWHWRDLLQQHTELLQTISWLEPEILKLVDDERFPDLYQAGPQ